MKINLYTAIAILFFLISSCSPEIPSENPVFKANFVDFLNAADYIESVDDTLLSGEADALFTQITDIEFFEGRWYIFDQDLKRILCFEENGSHVFTINRVGKGPGEYSHPESMILKKESREIWLSEDLNNSILKFDLSGNYLESIDVAQIGYDMIAVNENQLMLYQRYYRKYPGNDSVPPGLFLVESKINPRKQVLRINKNRVIDDSMTEFVLSKHDDTCYFLSASDSLYFITQDLKPQIAGVFDFGKYHMPYSIREIPWKESNFGTIDNTGKVTVKEKLVPTSDYFFLQIALHESLWYAVIDRQSHEMKISQGVVNTLDPAPFIFPIGAKNEDELVGFISSDLLVALNTYVQSAGPSEATEQINQLKAMIDASLNETGNILVTMKLKRKQT